MTAPRSTNAARVAKHRAKGCRVDVVLQDADAIAVWRALTGDGKRSQREVVEELLIAVKKRP